MEAAPASVCSWSGGKDSALALQLALETGAAPRALLSMLDESGERSRSHGLSLALLEAQAAAIGLPLVTRSASWRDYTDAFADGLAQLAAAGCTDCVFGDIDVDSHRRWCLDVCARTGLAARHPLWRRDRRALVDELLGRGFAATIVVVQAPPLDASFLGRGLDRALVDELQARGVDACGENGEYHTVVIGGPLFERPLELRPGDAFEVGDRIGLRVEAR